MTITPSRIRLGVIVFRIAGNISRTYEKTPRSMIGGSFLCSPDGIRTRATALRGRRPRPLDDGARTRFLNVVFQSCSWMLSKLSLSESGHKIDRISAGVPGLEPRMAVPETAVLPITPYPKVLLTSLARSASLLCSAARLRPKRRLPVPLPQIPNRMVTGGFCFIFGRKTVRSRRLPLPYRRATERARPHDRAIPSTRTAEG